MCIPAPHASRVNDLLDNISWHTLCGPHAKFAAGTNDVRRYAQGFSPIAAFAEPDHPNLSALAKFCDPGEHLYCDRWSGAAPSGWCVQAESTMFKMVWTNGSAADDAADAVALGPQHVQDALALTALTRPGPFGPRTLELGEYFGYFDGDRLIAMAGERMHAGSLREISGVCTHPDFQGRGLARRLMNKIIRRQLSRKQTPFLHVMRDNVAARKLYQKMGFRNYFETVVRVISRSES
jgi:ribosomal protein S18 acetylase RimI-like enzyme